MKSGQGAEPEEADRVPAAAAGPQWGGRFLKVVIQGANRSRCCKTVSQNVFWEILADVDVSCL